MIQRENKVSNAVPRREGGVQEVRRGEEDAKLFHLRAPWSVPSSSANSHVVKPAFFSRLPAPRVPVVPHSSSPLCL